MVIGILFLFAVTAVLILSGIFSLEPTKLTISTESIEALYDSTPLTNHNWKITRGALKNGHTISVRFSGSQTNVGESKNAIDIIITDEMGADVTSDYDITYDLGILKVNPRSLIITSASDSKLFDGYALQNPGYEITSEHRGLVAGHSAVVNVTGSITEVGETSNTVESVFIYDKYGADVTDNYHLFIREGVLKITSPYSQANVPTFNGDSDLSTGYDYKNAVLYSIFSNISERVYLKIVSYGNYNGQSWMEAPEYPELIDGKYSAAYLLGLSLNNSGSPINKIEIKSNYQPYALPYYMVPEEGNAETQTSDVSFSGGITNSYTVGYTKIGTDYPNVDKKYSQYESEYRKFVYSNYLDIDDTSRMFMENIIKKEGFTAKNKNIIGDVATYIQNSAIYNRNYDRKLEQENNIAIAFLSEYKEGVCRHYASAATLLYRALGIPARYTIGVTTALEAGKWKNVVAEEAHAWVEVYIDGTGWVCVEVTGGSGGHAGNCNCSGCEEDQTSSNSDTNSSGGSNNGTSGNGNSGNGNSGNGNSGNSTNPEAELKATLTPETVRKKYNGKSLKATNKLKGFEAFEKLGYTYKAVVEGSRTEAGISSSKIKSVTIYDKNKNDVTDLFDLTLKTGKIHVYLYTIEFSSPSADIVYDGKPAGAAIHTGGELVADHSFALETTAKTDAGIRLNTFNVVITDSNGKTVTDLYYVKKDYGSLVIRPAEITVKAGDAEKPYDGTPLTCHKVSIESGALAEGHILAMPTFIGSQTQIGRCDNIVNNISVLNAYGIDVTHNYIIKYIIGSLKITG